MEELTAEDKGLVFQIVGEGGGIQIIRQTIDKKFIFIYNHNESYFDDEFSVKKTNLYSDFETPLKLIFKTYPIHCLYITTVHNDYREFVANETLNKLNTKKITDFDTKTDYEKVLGLEFEFDKNLQEWKKIIK